MMSWQKYVQTYVVAKITHANGKTEHKAWPYFSWAKSDFTWPNGDRIEQQQQPMSFSEALVKAKELNDARR